MKKGDLWHSGDSALFGRLYPREQAYPLLGEGQCCLFAGISQNSVSREEGLHSSQGQRGLSSGPFPAKHRWEEKSSTKGRVRVIFIFTLEFIQPFVAFLPALHR